MYLLVNITSVSCFPICEIAASSCINEDSRKIHLEMINQNEIRMTSYAIDGCSTIVEVSRLMIICIIVYDCIIYIIYIYIYIYIYIFIMVYDYIICMLMF